MKKVLVATIVTAMVALAGTAMAAGSMPLTVEATVTAGCGIVNTSPVSFTIDPASASPATAIGGATVWCSTGTNGTVIINGNGLHESGGEKYMQSASTPTASIRYTLNVPAPAVPGSGRTNTINVPINGTVAVADFQNAVALDDYSDTVTVEINP